MVPSTSVWKGTPAQVRITTLLPLIRAPDREQRASPRERMCFHVSTRALISSGKTTVARLYYRLLKDLGVFAASEKRAHDARVAEEAEAKKKADAAEKARRDDDRRAFESAGLAYTPPTRPRQTSLPPAGKTTPTLPSGFVETTGADLAEKGVRGLKAMLDNIRKAGGGVLFVDEVGVPLVSIFSHSVCGKWEMLKHGSHHLKISLESFKRTSRNAACGRFRLPLLPRGAFELDCQADE